MPDSSPADLSAEMAVFSHWNERGPRRGGAPGAETGRTHLLTEQTTAFFSNFRTRTPCSVALVKGCRDLNYALTTQLSVPARPCPAVLRAGSSSLPHFLISFLREKRYNMRLENVYPGGCRNFGSNGHGLDAGGNAWSAPMSPVDGGPESGDPVSSPGGSGLVAR